MFRLRMSVVWGCGRYSISFVQLSCCLLHAMCTDWHVLFLHSFLLSLSNEVPTLIVFFLVAPVVLTWCVTPHRFSPRGYFRSTTAVNLPQEHKCVWMRVDMCRRDFVSICHAFYELIKQGSYAVFACAMPVFQNCVCQSWTCKSLRG